MVDHVYRMDVTVCEKQKARTADGEVEIDVKVYENTFWFKSVGMRKTCADRIRSLSGVTIVFSHETEHAPQTIKRMVAKRLYKPYA
jgi:hypothetical protein